MVRKCSVAIVVSIILVAASAMMTFANCGSCGVGGSPAAAGKSVVSDGVKKIGEIYKCSVCGNEITVTKVGGGQLVCCNRPMNMMQEGK